MCFCILENTIFFLYNLKPSTEASKLFSDNHLADLILECPCLSSREHILVHNGKGYFMPILHPQVACKRIDGSERACLGMHIPKDGRTLHPVFQCAVHTAYGERLIKFLKDWFRTFCTDVFHPAIRSTGTLSRGNSANA